MSERRILSVNGRLVSVSEAKTSVFDRGFMFGDGVYEVIRVYRGRTFTLPRHLDRLERSLNFLDIKGVDISAISFQISMMMGQVKFNDATIYIQVTRGVFPVRSHVFVGDSNPFEDSFPDANMKPTVLILISPYVDSSAPLRVTGCAAITYEDKRWLQCHIKSLNLLGNVLAAQAAKTAGVYESILVNNSGFVTEGSHTNVFAVIGGVIRTAPLTSNILPGVTRAVVLAMALVKGIRVAENSLTAEGLKSADEVFLTGTTTEVMPVININGQLVADGQPGPVTQLLQKLFAEAL